MRQNGKQQAVYRRICQFLFQSEITLIEKENHILLSTISKKRPQKCQKVEQGKSWRKHKRHKDHRVHPCISPCSSKVIAFVKRVQLLLGTLLRPHSIFQSRSILHSLSSIAPAPPIPTPHTHLTKKSDPLKDIPAKHMQHQHNTNR